MWFFARKNKVHNFVIMLTWQYYRPYVGNDAFEISELTNSQANQKKNLPRLFLSVTLHTALIRQFVTKSN